MGTTSAEELGFDAFSAELLLPGEPGYDEARKIQNGLIDKRPAVIVACRAEADVVEGVNFARDNGLELSIKCGGHHVAGVSVSDGGVMLDLGGLDALEIDVDARTLRAGGGLKWGEVIAATQEHGLATASGTDGDVGIAGLTLGGGLGFLLGKIGLTVDNLLAARVVTADGRVLEASADEHPDLFWALRGGGGNFGVVTEFTYRLHRIGPMVTGGMIAHPLEAAPDLLRFYREFTSGGLSDDAAVWVLLMHLPDGSGTPIIVFGIVHFGAEEDARRELAPLLEYGSPLMADVSPRPYLDLLSQLDAVTKDGLRNYVKSSFLEELSDDAIETLAASFASCPSPLNAVVLEHFHGKAARVPVEATAVAYRKLGYNLLVFGSWPESASNEQNIAWTREIHRAMSPFFDDRVWVNYVGIDDIGEDETARKAYGPNLERLIDVKTAYDPQNLFRLNLNIRPRSA